jgi:hypothetical protein
LALSCGRTSLKSSSIKLWLSSVYFMPDHSIGGKKFRKKKKNSREMLCSKHNSELCGKVKQNPSWSMNAILGIRDFKSLS